MKFSAYNFADLLNGEGCRVSIFVSGCSHACRGCYNQKTWKPDFGEKWTEEHLQKLIEDLSHPGISGLTLTGGDPLYEDNLEEVEKIVDAVKEALPEKTIWMWSGYYLEELNETRKRIVEKVDTFIDGRFEESLHDPKLLWRGSSNQSIWRISDGDIRQETDRLRADN